MSLYRCLCLCLCLCMGSVMNMSVCFVCICRYEVATVGFLWCVEKAREKSKQALSPERSERCNV